MNWKDEVRKRLADLHLNAAREQSIVDELADHMSDRYNDLLRSGVDDDKATRTVLSEMEQSETLNREIRIRNRIDNMSPATIEFGGRGNVFGDFGRDVRYAFRMLLANPAFTAIAVIALALGIGANTAIFSIVNSVLLRPLPFDEPERLMVIRETKIPQFPEFSVSPGNFLEWQKDNTVFERMVALRGTSFNLVEGAEPERLPATMVTDGFFSILGAKPQIGRDFLPEEDAPGHNKVVILSNGFWVRRFGADPTVLNRTLNLNGETYNVIGVMPPKFKYEDGTNDLWSPMAFTAKDAEQRGGHYLRAIGRLKKGINVEQAAAELSTIAKRMSDQYPDSNAGWGAKVMPMLEDRVRSLKPALLVLLFAVGFILLIACANVANLLLSRAAVRQKEIGIRAALGAGRWRIVRQLLTESLVLSLMGGSLGILVALWGTHVLVSMAPPELPRINQVSIDGRVLIFTFAITVLTGIIFGLVPAFQASKFNLNETLKEAGRGSTEGGNRQLVRSTLVVIEIAMALLLLVGAGLMIRSFARLQKVDPGFNPNNVLTVGISLPRQGYAEPDKQAGFFKQLTENLSRIPGIEAAAASVALPLVDDYVLGFEIKGHAPNPPGEDTSTNYYAITPDYFKAMGIRLIKGRLFNDRDSKDSPHVAIISETMASKYFPGEDPIGKFIHVTNGPETWREIVGIVNDVKQYGLDQEVKPQTYEPLTQKPQSDMMVVVRTTSNPLAMTSAVRHAVLEIDRTQPIADVHELEYFLSTSMAEQRLATNLLGIFAFLALALSAVGIYGVISYSVTQRTHEIGIRRALGASHTQILGLILKYGIGLTAVGVVVGVAGALALTRLMSSLLFGISATDPTTFIMISISLFVVAVVACVVPALRALKVDPMVALRYE